MSLLWLLTPTKITAYKVDAPQNVEAVVEKNPLQSLSEYPTSEEIKLAINFISDKYGWKTLAYSVLIAESGGNPKAENPEWHYDIYGNPICQGSFGLFQLACIHGLKEDLLNPVKNIEIAYALWKERSWFPWGVCLSGIVKCF